MTARVRVHGRGRLRRNAAKAGASITIALRQAVEDSTEAIAQDARSDAPVDRGVLQSDIEATVDPGGTTGTVAVRGPSAEYAPHVEHGTQDMDAEPFMLPAAERERRELPSRVKVHVRKALG